MTCASGGQPAFGQTLLPQNAKLTVSRQQQRVRADGDKESPAADSEREDSWLTQRMWTAVDRLHRLDKQGPHQRMLIGRIAGIWADLVSNDELDKAQQLLVTVYRNTLTWDNETLGEALLDTVRQKGQRSFTSNRVR